MYELRCNKCGNVMIEPNVLKCPYCNKVLRHQTDELASKHIRKCAFYLSTYQYSERKPGRPSKATVMNELFGGGKGTA